MFTAITVAGEVIVAMNAEKGVCTAQFTQAVSLYLPMMKTMTSEKETSEQDANVKSFRNLDSCHYRLLNPRKMRVRAHGI